MLKKNYYLHYLEKIMIATNDFSPINIIYKKIMEIIILWK